MFLNEVVKNHIFTTQIWAKREEVPLKLHWAGGRTFGRSDKIIHYTLVSQKLKMRGNPQSMPAFDFSMILVHVDGSFELWDATQRGVKDNIRRHYHVLSISQPERIWHDTLIFGLLYPITIRYYVNRGEHRKKMSEELLYFSWMVYYGYRKTLKRIWESTSDLRLVNGLDWVLAYARSIVESNIVNLGASMFHVLDGVADYQENWNVADRDTENPHDELIVFCERHEGKHQRDIEIGPFIQHKQIRDSRDTTVAQYNERDDDNAVYRYVSEGIQGGIEKRTADLFMKDGRLCLHLTRREEIRRERLAAQDQNEFILTEDVMDLKRKFELDQYKVDWAEVYKRDAIRIGRDAAAFARRFESVVDYHFRRLYLDQILYTRHPIQFTKEEEEVKGLENLVSGEGVYVFPGEEGMATNTRDTRGRFRVNVKRLPTITKFKNMFVWSSGLQYVSTVNGGTPYVDLLTIPRNTLLATAVKMYDQQFKMVTKTSNRISEAEFEAFVRDTHTPKIVLDAGGGSFTIDFLGENAPDQERDQLDFFEQKFMSRGRRGVHIKRYSDIVWTNLSALFKKWVNIAGPLIEGENPWEVQIWALYTSDRKRFDFFPNPRIQRYPKFSKKIFEEQLVEIPLSWQVFLQIHGEIEFKEMTVLELQKAAWTKQLLDQRINVDDEGVTVPIEEYFLDQQGDDVHLDYDVVEGLLQGVRNSRQNFVQIVIPTDSRNTATGDDLERLKFMLEILTWRNVALNPPRDDPPGIKTFLNDTIKDMLAAQAIGDMRGVFFPLTTLDDIAREISRFKTRLASLNALKSGLRTMPVTV